MEQLNLNHYLHVYAIALVTWLGVFLYLFRLEKMTRQLERDVERAERDAPARREDEQ